MSTKSKTSGYSINSDELYVLKKLADNYGSDVTLGELISNVNQVPVSEVFFNVEGNYNGYCYECSGDTFEISGTIKDIVEDEGQCEVSETPKEGFVKLSEVLGDTQLKSVTNLILGNGLDEEPCREFNYSRQSAPVTENQIIEYLKTLYVKNYGDDPFEYSQFICEF